MEGAHLQRTEGIPLLSSYVKDIYDLCLYNTYACSRLFYSKQRCGLKWGTDSGIINNMLISPSSDIASPRPPPQTRASKYSTYSGPDGELVPWREIMRVGGNTLTLRRENCIIKIPKKVSAVNYSSSYQPLALEIKVYERLGNYKGITKIFPRSNGIFEIPYYKNGSFENFLH
jgi:hypothetical protein